ncbi:MAG: hypothetical protein QOJ42_2164, partial [Acidobacteriaceae bacterium]|nr:hypothetical protein [Acidobacteriaceae bacterium]
FGIFSDPDYSPRQSPAWILSVPELTRSADIQLNKLV